MTTHTSRRAILAAATIPLAVAATSPVLAETDDSRNESKLLALAAEWRKARKAEIAGWAVAGDDDPREQ